MSKIYYFAYGANLHPEVLEGDRNVKVHDKQPCRLSNYRLTFDVEGLNFLEPSFANIVQDNTKHIWGVRFEISKQDFEKITGSESGYRVIDVEVFTKTDEQLKAKTLACIEPMESEKPPSKRYLSLIFNGAKIHKLPDNYMTFLDTLPSKHIPIVSQIHSAGLKIIKFFSFG